MGATNRSQTAYVAEVTKGTTPATPAFQAMRVTSNALAYQPTMVSSNEIRTDRQVTDYPLTYVQGAGNIGFELSYSAHDDFIEAALQGTWGNNPSALVTALTTTTATIASGGATYVAGHLIVATGFALAANANLLARVTSNTGTTVVCPASSFTAEATPPAAARIRVVGFEGAAGDLVATATGLTSTLLDFTTLGITPGEWHFIGGDVTTANAVPTFAGATVAGWARVSTIAAHVLVYDILPTGWTTDAGTSKKVQVFMGDFITNGTTQRAFTIERQQQDITVPSYEYFKGMQVNAFTMPVKAGEIMSGTFGFIGASTGYTSTTALSTTRFAGATDVAAPAFDVLNASSNVGRVLENGSVITGSFITEIGFNLNNNLAEQKAIGYSTAVGVRNGEVALGGTLTAYFNDTSLLAKVLANTKTSLMFKVGQPSANNRVSYIFDMPSVKLTGTAPVDAKNQDRMLNGTFQAFRDGTLLYTISTGRFAYLPVIVTSY